MIGVDVGKILVRFKRIIIGSEGGGYYRTIGRRWCGWEGFCEGDVRGSKKEGALLRGIMRQFWWSCDASF